MAEKVISSFSIQDLKGFVGQEWGVKKKQHCAALSKLEKHGFGFLQVFKDPTLVIIHYKESGLEKETCMRCLGYIRIIMEALLRYPENSQHLENMNVDTKALDPLKKLVDNVYNNDETDSIDENINENIDENIIDDNKCLDLDPNDDDDNNNGDNNDDGDIQINEINENNENNELNELTALTELTELDKGPVKGSVKENPDPIFMTLLERHQCAIDELNEKVEFLKGMVYSLAKHAPDAAKQELLLTLMAEKFEKL